MDIQPHSTPERIESSITSVTDSQGDSVPPDTTTEDTVLTLTGSGTASSIVFIFDNDVLLTPASVTINRTWNFTETVALGRHAFTVRDSLGGVDSPEWVVTVGEAVVTPEITLVTDSNGEIEPDGNTFDTSVTLTGTAKASETVELFQDGALQGDVPVNPSGVWTRPVTGLTVTNHNFQVRGRYGNNPVSNVRSLTVLASDAPTISNIQDAAGVEIPPNTTTFNTSVTLSGTAAAGQQVQIFDGASSLGIVTATGGTWTLPLTGLALKAYSVKVRGLYGSNPESDVRTFTVATALDIDRSPVVLNGIRFNTSEWPRNGRDVQGNTVIRFARGGVPPYVYRSGNPGICSVNNQGKATGLRDGSTTIYADDNAGNS
ncbi:hypothetical protein [Pseudomonas syringae group sp. J309-1]|uniref:hypothetical protein n=1 Tax=Pseudomonas syringae group sp. J309-1 TaxID=3079588 RepID=UPI002912DB3C|nr:hypothetical protein [Pseudomonas syringae group sp. J309-1]MDU8362610.1 hypothetical protein [Pseudomonas syringae group sp. J309-1]